MYSIGWIAALEKELTAALAILDETHQQPEDFEQNDKDSNTYSWGKIGDHNIVIASLGGGSYGLVSAATTATCMANSLPHLRFGLMVGIGAGVPNLEGEDIRLGDVVVSLPKDGHPGVVQYDFGKMRGRNQFERVGALAPPPTVLLKAMDKLRAEQRFKGSKLPQILSRTLQNYPMLTKSKGKDPAFVHQGAMNDRLFEATFLHVSGEPVGQDLSGRLRHLRISHTQSCTSCDAEGEIEREKRPNDDPEIHYGTIASGNLVIKDGIFRDEISQQLGTDVLCYEMEAAGLMNDFPCLVIRGICDYADTHKNDRWQNYAALVAASYTKELLGVINARSVERAERLDEFLITVSNDVSRIDSTTEDIHKKVQNLACSQLLERITRWLAAPNPSGNHNDAFKQHHPDTGKWFLQHEMYKQWETTSTSCLWLYGLPGCGKTVLSSAIINDLESRETEAQHLLYFYFTFSDVGKQTLDGAVRSLINQLCSKSEAARQILTTVFHSEHREGSKQPSTSSLCDTFDTMVKVSGRVWIVLDALDECKLGNTFANEGLLTWLNHILERKHANLCMLVTSRREKKIRMILDECIPEQNRICLQSDIVDNDIRTFVDTTLRTWTPLKDWQEYEWIQEEIKDHLTKNAHGMFRWVSCQLYALEHLSGCKDYAALKRTLGSLPITLDETYARILKGIPNALREGAQKVLQFLLYSETPLRIEEAAEIALVFPGARRSERILNTMIKPDLEAVLVYCPNLVKIVTQFDYDTGEVQVLELSHFSVKEYLLSSRLDEQTSWTFGKVLAQASMAAICLAYLLEIKHDQPLDKIIPSHPLALYAASFWVNYASQAGENMNLRVVEEFVRDRNCQRTYYYLRHSINHRRRYQGLPLRKFQPKRDGRLLQDPRFSKQYPHSDPLLVHFAQHGLICGVEDILQMDAGAVNVQGGNFGNALQAAASQGHNDIVQKLLHKGANVNAQGGHFGNALMAAVGQSYAKTVEILLDHKADFDQQTFDVACVEGDTTVLRLMLKGISAAAASLYCNNSFLVACAKGHRDIVDILIGNNANVQTRDRHGRTGLWYAATGGREEVVELLLAKGAKHVAEYHLSISPLYAAVKNHNIDVIRLLVAEDEDVPFFDPVLRFAVSRSQVRVVEILLESLRANRQSKDNRQTLTEALQIAISGFKQGYDIIAKLLLENGAVANATVYDGSNLLCCMLEESHRTADEETVRRAVALLLDYGADPNDGRGERGNALETALWAQYRKVANMLVEAGAKTTSSLEPCRGSGTVHPAASWGRHVGEKRVQETNSADSSRGRDKVLVFKTFLVLEVPELPPRCFCGGLAPPRYSCRPAPRSRPRRPKPLQPTTFTGFGVHLPVDH